MKSIDEMCAVMQAFKDGKKVECRMIGYDDWEETDDVQWNWALFDYRVKPEPEYVPYDWVFEVNRSKWVRNKNYPGVLRPITMIDTIKNAVHITGCGWNNLEEFFKRYEYEDGTPCGKLVEE